MRACLSPPLSDLHGFALVSIHELPYKQSGQPLQQWEHENAW